MSSKAADHLAENYAEVLGSLCWSIERAEELIKNFDATVEQSIELRGAGHPFDQKVNALKALDSFVDMFPTGDEQGKFYAIDLGGTNLRAVCVQVEGNGVSTTTTSEMNIRDKCVSADTPKGLLDKNIPANVMFDTIAKQTKELMLQVKDDPSAKRKVSFTFSFPMAQESICNGRLGLWTKEFETGRNTNDPVEGQDVAELLNAAFRRAKMGCVVGAVANDTVGTLMSAGYEHNSKSATCRVGVILGTGYNIASYDPVAAKNGFSGSIINHECGNYDGVLQFSSMMDIELDYNSTSKGTQLSEKMISGHYLAEICRLAILKVFQYRCTEDCWTPWSFTTPEAAKVYADNTKSFSVTRKAMKSAFNWDVSSEEELRMIYKLICAVFDRSATIAALQTIVFVNRTRHLQKALGGVTVGIDGSLYLKNPKYRKTFRKTLDKVLGSRSELVNIVEANDGSGKGAAMIAACQNTQG